MAKAAPGLAEPHAGVLWSPSGVLSWLPLPLAWQTPPHPMATLPASPAKVGPGWWAGDGLGPLTLSPESRSGTQVEGDCDSSGSWGRGAVGRAERWPHSGPRSPGSHRPPRRKASLRGMACWLGPSVSELLSSSLLPLRTLGLVLLSPRGAPAQPMPRPSTHCFSLSGGSLTGAMAEQTAAGVSRTGQGTEASEHSPSWS